MTKDRRNTGPTSTWLPPRSQLSREGTITMPGGSGGLEAYNDGCLNCLFVFCEVGPV